jgi:hypothetical protein
MQKKTNQLLENRVRKIYEQILREDTSISDPKAKDFYRKLDSLITNAESKGVNYNVIINILSNYPNVKFV